MRQEETELKPHVMKKFITVIPILIMVFFAIKPAYSTPIFIGGIRIYWAKWSVTFNDCQDGRGICIQIFTDGPSSDNYFGYDPKADQVILKISKNEQEVSHIIRSVFTIDEDSPISPRLIEKIKEFRTDGKIVTLKKGIYKAVEDGNFYTFNIGYYLQ